MKQTFGITAWAALGEKPLSLLDEDGVRSPWQQTSAASSQALSFAI
jgi:hypothetical protein